MKSNRALSLCLPALVATTAILEAGQPAVTGHVTDPEGRPPAHIRIVNPPWEETMTDADGTFTLEHADGLIRISLQGYQPRTVAAADLTAPIVIRPSDEPPRRITACEPALPNDRRWIGALRLRPPRGAHVKKGSEVDYTVEYVRLDGHWLTHGSGPNWSKGVPTPNDLGELTHVTERDATLPIDVVAAEYRGQHRDGSFFAFIGLFGETIRYDHASAKAAAYFDRLLDAVCWQSYSAP